MGYIEHGIDTFISNHPIHFRPMLQRIKGLILYCYNRSAMISRTMYISLLALDIIFTGFLLNHCTTISHYILVFLSFIFIFIVSGILGSCIFLLIDRLLSRFKRNTEADNIESSSCEADSTSEKESTDNTLSTTNSDKLTHSAPKLHNKIYDTNTTDNYKPVRDTDFISECLRYARNRDNASKEKILVINNPETIATLENVGKYAITEGTITATMIQHKFNTSFFTACSIIDMLEEYNVISSNNSSSPVKVLMTLDDFNTLLATFYDD